MRETQAGKFMISKKVNVEFSSPELSATKIVTWKFHFDESTNGKYDIILGRDLITALVLDLKFYDNVMIGRHGPYEGCLSLMVGVNNYNFKYITDKTIKPKESFVNLFVHECLKPNSAKTSTRRMHRILDTKYEKSDLNNVMTEQCKI